MVDVSIYREVLDNSSDPIFSFERDGTYLYLNNAFGDYIGRNPEDVIGKRIWDVFPGAEGDMRFAAVKHVFETGEQKVIEVKVEHAGTISYFITTVKPIKDDAGDVIRVVCISKDITEQKKSELNLKRNEENFRRIFEVNPFPLVIADMDEGSILYANSSAAVILGNESILGHKIMEFYNDAFELKGIQDKISNNENVTNLITNIDVNGDQKWVLANISGLIYNDIPSILIGFTDITEIKKIETELMAYATTDPLTGVYNRRKGYELLDVCHGRAIREGYSYAVFFVDVDNLKGINDLFGHGEGDWLLQRVASVLQEIVPCDAFICRMGGDEFMLVLCCLEENMLDNFRHKLDISLRDAGKAENKPYSISVSHGYAVNSRERDIDVCLLLEEADKNMYQCKRDHKIII